MSLFCVPQDGHTPLRLAEMNNLDIIAQTLKNPVSCMWLFPKCIVSISVAPVLYRNIKCNKNTEIIICYKCIYLLANLELITSFHERTLLSQTPPSRICFHFKILKHKNGHCDNDNDNDGDNYTNH